MFRTREKRDWAPPRPEEPPSKSSPINATRFRRITTMCAVSLLKPIRRTLSRVLLLSSTICVKHGTYVDLSEAATMAFIREHTSIPVPKVYCSFTYNGTAYIVMQRIKGHKLAIGWSERFRAVESSYIGAVEIYGRRNANPTATTR